MLSAILLVIDRPGSPVGEANLLVNDRPATSVDVSNLLASDRQTGGVSRSLYPRDPAEG